MKDLIEKLAQADGPSRELDAEIELAMGLQHPDGVAECLAWLDQEHLAECPTHGLLPRYTASIDAALTLVRSATWTSPETWTHASHSEPW